MEPLCPIFWEQGMFLQPQHFEQPDGYHAARLYRYRHWLSPFAWGVKSLVILQEAEVPDLLAAEGQRCTVHYLLYALQVFDSDAAVQTHDDELIKVAELLRAPAGPGAVLSKRDIPPCLSIYASPVLAGLLRELCERQMIGEFATFAETVSVLGARARVSP